MAKIIIEYEKDQDAGYDGNHKPVKTIEGGKDADDPSGTVGVARGTRGSSAGIIPRRF